MSQINDYWSLAYLALQAHHPVQVPQEVPGFRQVLENLGNLDFLCLRADLGYLIPEDRGLPSLRLNQGIL